jgi:hypothetical protein
MTQKHRLQKMSQRELGEKIEDEEWDYLFNRLWPMTKPKQTWWEKQLANVENCHIPKFSFRNVNHFSHKKLKISKKNSFILT